MAWELTGNADTNPVNNFLGTSDNQSLAMKTNAGEVMGLGTNGKIGVGTPNPDGQLHLSGGYGI
jgi:hypothetical protein